MVVVEATKAVSSETLIKSGVAPKEDTLDSLRNGLGFIYPPTHLSS